MKYRIKYDRGSSATYPYFVDGDIIELEEVEESSFGKTMEECNCGVKNTGSNKPKEPNEKQGIVYAEEASLTMCDKCGHLICKPKETKESLEDAFQSYITHVLGIYKSINAAHSLSQIAREHFKDNPEEIDMPQDVHWQLGFNAGMKAQQDKQEV